jgi:hypothetical protein
MENRQMYGLLALADIASTIVLQLMADMNKNPEEMTKEDWIVINRANVERRKSIMEKIRSH